MKPLGLYVHIPFCAWKCAYCDFASWAGRAGEMPRYTETVCREIARRGEICGHPYADTVFFGGGTPSLLPPELFEKICATLRESFDISPDAEWTTEVNPGTLNIGFVRTLVKCGVNRVSMGMQAAQERILSELGRIHRMEDVEESVKLLRAVGIENFNLDLMLGLPSQTMADWRETIDRALALHPTHLSCYALIVEDGTEMQRRVERGTAVLPDEDTEREMYGVCRETLQKNGFHQYEISNFAREGFECRHNVNCWKREDYLGFGCAAHSLYENERRANPRELTDYLFGKQAETEKIPDEDAMFESLMLGLRLTKGIEEKDFERRYGKKLMDVYGKRLLKALGDGRLERKDGFLFLTSHGMDVMNSVLVEVMGD